MSLLIKTLKHILQKKTVFLLLFLSSAISVGTFVANASLCTPPPIMLHPSEVLYCLDEPAKPLRVYATGTNLTYQWYSRSIAGYETLIPGATSATFTPPTNAAHTGMYYYCRIGSTDCSPEYSRTSAKVIVSAPPTAGIIALPISPEMENDSLFFGDTLYSSSSQPAEVDDSVKQDWIVFPSPLTMTDDRSTQQNLLLKNHIGFVQWQESADAMSFTDIPDATSEMYNTGELPVGTYYYRAKVFNGCDFDYTEPIQINTKWFCAPLPCPEGVVAKNPTYDGFTASWKPVKDAAWYIVNVYEYENENPVDSISNISGTSKVIGGLAPGTNYTFKVMAKGNCPPDGDSRGCIFSNEIMTLWPITVSKFFSPDGDGINSKLLIEGLIPYYSNNFEPRILIYDRFGNLLCDSHKKADNIEWDGEYWTWDGTYMGKPLPSDEYWYVIELKGMKNIPGHFSLKRKWDK